MNLGALLLTAAAGGTVWYLSKYAKTGFTLYNMQYSFAGVKINKKRTNLTQLVLDVGIDFLNPGKNTATLEAFNATLQYKGKIIGFINSECWDPSTVTVKDGKPDFSKAKHIEVPAFQDKVVGVTAEIKLLSLLPIVTGLDIDALLAGTKPNISIDMKGRLKANGQFFPVDFPFTF